MLSPRRKLATQRAEVRREIARINNVMQKQARHTGPGLGEERAPHGSQLHLIDPINTRPDDLVHLRSGLNSERVMCHLPADLLIHWFI